LASRQSGDELLCENGHQREPDHDEVDVERGAGADSVACTVDTWADSTACADVTGWADTDA
jgi:hypothetical protein